MWTIAILYNYVFYIHIFVNSMYTHLCFNFKSLRKNRESLNKSIAEGSITRHNIFYVVFKQCIDTCSHYGITKIMKRSLILFKISRRKPIPNYHISSINKDFIHHLFNLICRICIISINHYITLCINFSKHTSYYISFSLLKFISYNSTCFSRNLISSVCWVIIINIYYCLRELFSKICNHLFNSFWFIITWY